MLIIVVVIGIVRDSSPQRKDTRTPLTGFVFGSHHLTRDDDYIVLTLSNAHPHLPQRRRYVAFFSCHHIHCVHSTIIKSQVAFHNKSLA